MSGLYEVCLSKEGRETRLPALNQHEAVQLAALLAQLYPTLLVEIINDGIRHVVS